MTNFEYIRENLTQEQFIQSLKHQCFICPVFENYCSYVENDEYYRPCEEILKEWCESTYKNQEKDKWNKCQMNCIWCTPTLYYENCTMRKDKIIEGKSK